MNCYRLLLLTPTYLTYEIKNITNNPGLLASQLGASKIIEGYHTLTHYYELGELKDKTNRLKEIYLEISETIATDRTAHETSQSLFSTFNSTLSVVENKIDDLLIPLSSRQKRGLINGLGSTIKFITGNLDSQDEERYDNIISLLQNKQQDLQTQISAQYSINESIQRNFNKTIETVNFNNKEIRKELEFWKNQTRKWTSQSKFSIFETRSILQHCLITLNYLLNTIQDIENSLVACRSGTLHPSVINPHLLFQELSKLSKFYGTKFLDFNGRNLFEIQSYIKVKCYVSVSEIVYFLDIPIVESTDYVMYHLEPLPTLANQEYVTIIPELKYFLKSESKIVPLTQRCPIGHIQLCPNYLVSLTTPKCEINFLASESTSDCKFIKLITNENFIKPMLEINRYLLFFPKGDSISISQAQSTETKTLFGTYLAHPGKQLIQYKNKTLFAPHNEFAGKPLIIGDFNLKLRPDQEPHRELMLKELDLESISLPDVRHIQTFEFASLAQPSVWTIIIYLLLITIISYTSIKYYKHVRSSACETTT